MRLKHSGFSKPEHKFTQEDIANFVLQEILPFLAVKKEEVPQECSLLNKKFWLEISTISENLGLGEDALELPKIQNSLKKLDRQYQRIFEVNDVDGRFFLEDRKRNITPSKFTPFTK